MGISSSPGATVFTQANRPLQVKSPLGDDVFVLNGLYGEERVSKPFELTLDLTSTLAEIAAADVLGKPMVVTIAPGGMDGEPRVIHGLVRRFSQSGLADAGTARYRAEVVAWPWFLSLSSDCRIFQKKNALEIVEQVFKDAGFQDFKNSCNGTPPTREYCVQYRESHLDFVSRLLEEEGIYYFFEHSDDKHVLTLADSSAPVAYVTGEKQARYMPGDGTWPDENVVRRFEQVLSVGTQVVALTDYDFASPSLTLLRSVRGSDKKQQGEVYDYPANALTPDDVERYAQLRLEEREAQMYVVRGESNCRTFQSGSKFDLVEHYRGDANQTYLLLRVRHLARTGSLAGAGASSTFEYTNEFEAVPFSVKYRPPSEAPRPRVYGSQTAVVVGPGGEEIFVDKHSRVKVQFHWDRVGKKNENSSCWVRVSSAWAGKGYGQLTVPRIGQEVVVDFLEGDPDRPLITGRVFNAEQAPPCDPGGKGGVVSGLRSKTHKGSGYNEMTMDDTAGKEKITIHAQYDMDTTIEHDETHTVKSGNRTIKVETGTHTETIKGDTSITIQSGTYKLDVAAKTHTHHVTGDVSETYDANQTTKVAHKIMIDGGDEIKLVSGASSITLKKDGSITIEGINVAVKGSADVTIKGMMVHSEADAQHQTKGAVVLSEGSATNTIKGGMVMLNP
jgi:type VI secretion system secreted protein VgrG